MANNFTTLQTNAASEKFILCRVEPARSVEGDLTLSSGTTYTATFAFSNVSKIEVNGTAYTEVSGTPSSSQYSFNESTKLITINLGAALTTQIVVVYYYLFYTQRKARVTYENPESSSTTNRVWFPRIAETPSFSYTLDDIDQGLFSLGSSSLTIFNEDEDFNQYLGNNDSFSNKEIVFWLCLDSVENIKLLYKGIIDKVVVSRRVNISFKDTFNILSKIYYSNGSLLNSTYNTTRFANLHPPQENTPIRKLFAECTKYEVISDTTASGLYKVKPDSMLEAACVNYNATISTSNNRVWGTVLAEGDGGLQSDTVGSVDNSDPNYIVLGYTTGKKYRIGDTIKVGSTPEYLRVFYNDEGNEEIWCTKPGGTVNVSDAITRPGISPIVVRQDTTDYYLLFDRDYTVSYSGNTNDIVQITFANNFEATHSMATLDPGTHRVFYRAWANTSIDLDHADVMSTILTAAGISVNSASITQANSDLSATTNFYLPYVNETSFVSYRTIIEDLLFSTLGYLSLNSSQEVEYGVFQTLSATNEITDRQIILNSFKVSIDYNDLISTIKPENPHDIIEVGYTNASLENNKARYLHGNRSQRTYFHILSSTSRMQKLLDVFSERKAIYTYRIKTTPLAKIGDEYTLTRSNLISGGSSDDVVILGVEKTTEETTITATDLYGI